MNLASWFIMKIPGLEFDAHCLKASLEYSGSLAICGHKYDGTSYRDIVGDHVDTFMAIKFPYGILAADQ